MSSFTTWFSKWWPSVLPGVVALWGTYGTQIQSFVSAHPSIALFVSAAYSIFAHLMPSPASAPKA